MRRCSTAPTSGCRAKCIPIVTPRPANASNGSRCRLRPGSTRPISALKDPVARAQYLLSLHGVDAFDETDTGFAFDFLERQLERRRLPPTRRTAATRARSRRILGEVRAEAARARSSACRRCSTSTGMGRGAGPVRELRFLTKVVADIDAMLAAVEG